MSARIPVSRGLNSDAFIVNGVNTRRVTLHSGHDTGLTNYYSADVSKNWTEMTNFFTFLCHTQ